MAGVYLCEIDHFFRKFQECRFKAQYLLEFRSYLLWRRVNLGGDD